MARPGSDLVGILACFAFLPSLLLTNIVIANPQVAAAQHPRVDTVEGYITAVHEPTGFDVNGERVSISHDTTYGLAADKQMATDRPLRDAVRVGAYVFVSGEFKGKPRTLIAGQVRFRDERDRKLSGLGVIEAIVSNGAEPVFQADGYRIRIVPETEKVFRDDPKTMADVGVNTWLHYEGRRYPDGDLVASKVEFIGLKPLKLKSAHGLEVPGVALIPADASRNPDGWPLKLKDASALLPNDRVRVKPFGRLRRILADQSLQERVQRVGMRVVPQYQRNLKDDHPSKIHFYFYVVEDKNDRCELIFPGGLVLVPKAVMDRLKSDDQLAAVLADEVALNLQWQGARFVPEYYALLGVYAAGEAALFMVPGVGAAAIVGSNAAAGKILAQMEEQRGRVALALMADAGYDPWQAPEAWRLLEPKKLPADLDSLKYPNRSSYQLGILSLQYKPAGQAKTQ